MVAERKLAVLVPKARSRSRYSLTIWPSLDFSIGNSQPPRGDKGAHPLEGISKDAFGISFEARQPDPREISPDEAIALAIRLYDLPASEKIPEEKIQAALDNLASIASGENRSPMGLSGVPNSHKISRDKINRPKRYGSKGISVFGKRMVRSCGVVLEDRHGRECLSLGTATLPPLSPEELIKVCGEWPEITRKFFQEVGRLLSRKGLSPDVVYVSEIQEKRYHSWGQVYPHLHWVCQGRATRFDEWAIAPIDVRQIWERILANCLGRSVNGASATRIEKPKKSLAAELGKYLSKGGKILARVQSDGKGDYLPRSWWGASRGLKAEVRQKTIKSSGELANLLIDRLEVLKESHAIWVAPIMISVADQQTGIRREIQIGVVGRFKSKLALHKFLTSDDMRKAA